MRDPEEMISHLAQHRRAGHYVPEDAILALWEDIPGAQRSKGEDPVFTRVTLEMQIVQLRVQIALLDQAPPSEIEKAIEEFKNPDGKSS